ncbi:restriction endonuclease subunit S [candidate division KSB1 bacterium]|nr:restriction endonuclease subunit S [candidate division KSB1 bacterium]
MKVKVGRILDIAEIHSGIFRKPVPAGTVIYLQANHFDDCGHVKPSTVLAQELERDDSVEKHILKDQDILFAAKGYRNFAATYSEHIGPAVASSSLFVIRLKNSKKDIVLAEYLAWYLNYPNTLYYLQANAKVGTIPSVSKVDLSNLQIPIPAIERQKKILVIAQLAEKEKSLYNQIAERKHFLYNALMYEWAHEE